MGPVLVNNFSKLSSSISIMETCYRFCQQYKDYFKIVETNRPHCILFVTSFLCGAVVQRWHQYKLCSEGVPMTQAKFNDCFEKSLGDDWAFANSICSKFRQDFQYQAKFILDQVAYLKYLQSILLEYDPVGASTKLTMLKYFWEGLKPFILAELEYQDLKLESFDQIIKKTVNVKAKLALCPHSSTKKMDQNCPQDN